MQPANQNNDPLALTALRAMASSVLARCGDDRAKAASEIAKIAESDDRYFKALMKPKLNGAIWELLRQLDRKKPAGPIHNEPKPVEPVGIQSDTTQPDPTLAAVAARNWLDYPMFNGTPLGNANRDMLTRAVEHHKDRARIDTNHAAFFNNLAQRIGNQNVRDAFDSSTLGRLAMRFGL